MDAPCGSPASAAARSGGRAVQAVALLGAGDVAFEQSEDALIVRLPATRPVAFAPVLRVRGLI